MILAALTDEFRILFGRFPDRRIALWFDDKREFERLLAGFESYARGLKLLPFVLLRYDEALHHGQLWIKHQIYGSAASFRGSRRRRGRHRRPALEPAPARAGLTLTRARALRTMQSLIAYL